MDAEIRLIDLFEAVLERPYLYTLHGSYPEAIAYLDGCYYAFMHHRTEDDSVRSPSAVEIRRYALFSLWLAERFNLTGSRAAFRWVGDRTETPSKLILELYREFKEGFQG